MDDSYQLKFATAGTDCLQLALAGSWETHHALPESGQLESWLDSHPDIKQIGFDSTALTAWDSALLTFLVRLADSIEAAANKAEGLLNQSRGVVSSIDVNSLESLVQELSRAARSIRVFAEYMERHPEALIKGKNP